MRDGTIFARSASLSHKILRLLDDVFNNQTRNAEDYRQYFMLYDDYVRIML